MGHWYNPRTNERSDFPIDGWLPSVNTILAATRPHSHKKTLAAAALKNPYEFAQKTQRACDRGDSVHAWIAAYLQRLALPEMSLKHQQMCDRVKPYLDELCATHDLVFVECPVFGDGFAGQPDVVIRQRMGYKLKILDFKTKERPIVPQALHEGAIQLAGYAEGYEHQHTEPIQETLLVVIYPNYVQAHTFEPSAYLPEWINRREAYAGVCSGT